MKINESEFSAQYKKLKQTFDKQFKLFEGKYIADEFRDVIESIIKQINFDLTTVVSNQLQYTNYCFDEDSQKPVFALPFEKASKQFHKICLLYIDDETGDSLVQILIRDISGLSKEQTKTDTIVIEVNKFIYDSYDELTRPVFLKNGLADEFTHVHQMYKPEISNNETDIKIPIVNSFIEDIKNNKFGKINSDIINSIKYLLYLINSNEQEAHISSLESALDELTEDNIKDIKSTQTVSEMILKTIKMTNKEHSYYSLFHYIEIIKQLYKTSKMSPILIIAYYLKDIELIEDKNNILRTDNINELISMETNNVVLQYLFDKGKEYATEITTIGNQCLEFIEQKVFDYKNEIIETVKDWLIKKHFIEVTFNQLSEPTLNIITETDNSKRIKYIISEDFFPY